MQKCTCSCNPWLCKMQESSIYDDTRCLICLVGRAIFDPPLWAWVSGIDLSHYGPPPALQHTSSPKQSEQTFSFLHTSAFPFLAFFALFLWQTPEIRSIVLRSCSNSFKFKMLWQHLPANCRRFSYILHGTSKLRDNTSYYIAITPVDAMVTKNSIIHSISWIEGVSHLVPDLM